MAASKPVETGPRGGLSVRPALGCTLVLGAVYPVAAAARHLLRRPDPPAVASLAWVGAGIVMLAVGAYLLWWSDRDTRLDPGPSGPI